LILYEKIDWLKKLFNNIVKYINEGVRGVSVGVGVRSEGVSVVLVLSVKS